MLDVAMDYPSWLDPVLVSLGPVELFGFQLGPFHLRWYALAYIGGLLLGWQYMLRLVRREALWPAAKPPMTVPQVDDFLFYATLGVIIGGRLGHVFFYETAQNPTRLLKDPLYILRVWEGGMSFHGGLLGVALAIFWFARANKVPLLTLGDLAAAATPIGLFFGRIANFINAELYGRVTDVPWAMRFPLVETRDGQVLEWTQPRHPSQLYEAVLEGLVLFTVLWWLIHKRDALKRPGFLIGAFLFGYGVFRSGVELVREPDSGMPEFLSGWFTMGMALSLPMIVIGAVMMARAKPAATLAKA